MTEPPPSPAGLPLPSEAVQGQPARRGFFRRLLFVRRDRVVPPSHLVSISRNAVASVIATAAEAIILPTLTEVFGVYYMVSLVCGMLAATTISFFLNKYWVFEARQGRKRWQYVRQILVAVGSFLGNGGLVWVLTEYVGLHYMISFVLAGITVFLGWNYPAGRWLVFYDGHGPRRPR